MRLVLRILLLPLAFLLGACLWVVGCLLAACLLPYIPQNLHPEAGGTIPIYVRTNGAHVDVVVPVTTQTIDWREVADPRDTRAMDRAANLPFLSFGWGAKEFYLNVPTWEDLTARVAVRAVFGMGGSALHTRYEWEPRESADCRKLLLREDQYRNLVAFFLSAACRNDHGRFVSVDTTTRYDTCDAFYEGRGRYTPVNTCNSWANRALDACGQRCCLWTVLPQPILWQCTARGGQL